MNPLIESQLFFFISSVGFIILGLLATILLIEAVFVGASFLRIMTKIEQNIDEIGDTTREVLEDFRDSMVFR
ncbi:MAG: hypothetical protein WCQ60_02230, partial [bacterium]